MIKIKTEYLEYSIGGGNISIVKLKNLNPNLYQKYIDLGYGEYFDNVIINNKSDDEVKDEIIEMFGFTTELNKETITNEDDNIE